MSMKLIYSFFKVQRKLSSLTATKEVLGLEQWWQAALLQLQNLGFRAYGV